jgi:hypothetical protein
MQDGAGAGRCKLRGPLTTRADAATLRAFDEADGLRPNPNRGGAR